VNQSEGDGVSPKVVALNVRWLVIIGVFWRRWHVAKNFWARPPEWARKIVIHITTVFTSTLQHVFCMSLVGEQLEYDPLSR